MKYIPRQLWCYECRNNLDAVLKLFDHTHYISRQLWYYELRNVKFGDLTLRGLYTKPVMEVKRNILGSVH